MPPISLIADKQGLSLTNAERPATARRNAHFQGDDARGDRAYNASRSASNPVSKGILSLRRRRRNHDEVRKTMLGVYIILGFVALFALLNLIEKGSID